MTRLILVLIALLALARPGAAQDIRGLEVCTAEKAMDRRTSCLQSNVEFLQQTLSKQTRDIIAVNREAAAQKTEIAGLKAALAKLEHELAELKKPKPENKPENKPEKK